MHFQLLSTEANRLVKVLKALQGNDQPHTDGALIDAKGDVVTVTKVTSEYRLAIRLPSPVSTPGSYFFKSSILDKLTKHKEVIKVRVETGGACAIAPHEAKSISCNATPLGVNGIESELFKAKSFDSTHSVSFEFSEFTKALTAVSTATYSEKSPVSLPETLGKILQKVYLDPRGFSASDGCHLVRLAVEPTEGSFPSNKGVALPPLVVSVLTETLKFAKAEQVKLTWGADYIRISTQFFNFTIPLSHNDYEMPSVSKFLKPKWSGGVTTKKLLDGLKAHKESGVLGVVQLTGTPSGIEVEGEAIATTQWGKDPDYSLHITTKRLIDSISKYLPKAKSVDIEMGEVLKVSVFAGSFVIINPIDTAYSRYGVAA